MSKWTLIRKTEATRFDRLQNLWEGCFKMKVDHCKNQGVTRFGFDKHTVKVQTGIRAKRRSHGSCKRAGATGEKSKEGSHNLNSKQI